MLEQKVKSPTNRTMDQDIRGMGVEVVFFNEDDMPRKGQTRTLTALLAPLRAPVFRLPLFKR